MPFFYVGIHKAERGSEFSKLISSIWPNSLILFLEPLGTKYTYTHSHTHTLSLSVSGLAFLLGAPVWLRAISVFLCIGFFEALNTFSAASRAEGSLPCALTVIMQRLQLHLLSPLMSSCS